MSTGSCYWISEVLIDLVAFAKLNGMKRLSADLVEILKAHPEIRRPAPTVEGEGEATSASIWIDREGEVVTTLLERRPAADPSTTVVCLASRSAGLDHLLG